MDAAKSVPVLSDPFSVGVQLAVIVEYLEKSNLPENATATDFCEIVIKPLTEQFQCSLAEYYSFMRPSAIGKPVGFISYAW
jgi:hypothetical protein